MQNSRGKLSTTRTQFRAKKRRVDHERSAFHIPHYVRHTCSMDESEAILDYFGLALAVFEFHHERWFSAFSASLFFYNVAMHISSLFQAHAVVVCTEWDEFNDLDYER